MPREVSKGKPTTRRYAPDERAQAVRLVSALRAELGSEHGTVQRVASQLGYGTESVRLWVRQADIDEGYAPGVRPIPGAGARRPARPARARAARADVRGRRQRGGSAARPLSTAHGIR
jgi:transposase